MASQLMLIFSVIVLFILVCYLIYRLIEMYKSLNQLKKELNNQTLDYHLKRVKELGYDFTIKAGNHLKSSGDAKVKGKKSISSSKSFNDLIEKE